MVNQEGQEDMAYWDDKYDQSPFCYDCGVELPDYWDIDYCEECDPEEDED